MFQIMHISERMNILKGGFLGKRMKGGAGIYEFARCIIMLIQKKTNLGSGPSNGSD